MTDMTAHSPIVDDLATSIDALDFAPYVDALSEILLDTSTCTPLTLGVFGSWGSGKTSLMQMLRKRVARSECDTATGTHRTIWFNAWKYNQEEALWRALLLVLLDDLEQLLEVDPPRRSRGSPILRISWSASGRRYIPMRPGRRRANAIWTGVRR